MADPRVDPRANPLANPLADLSATLDVLLRFGGLMLRAGDTAFRVREAMARLAGNMGIENLSLQVTLDAMSATIRRQGETATLTCDVGAPGINAARIGALERLAEASTPGLTPDALGQALDRIERGSPLHALPTVAIAIGLASGAFSYLNGGDLLATGAAVVAGAVGQAGRGLMFRHQLNQYAVTAVCAVIASGLYCLIVFGLAGQRLLRPARRGLHLLGAFPGAGLSAGRLAARSCAAPDPGRRRAALLRHHDPAGRRLRPVGRGGRRRPDGRIGTRCGCRHGCDDRRVARGGELRRRLRLRAPLQQPPSNGADRRSAVADRQRAAAGAARSRPDPAGRDLRGRPGRRPAGVAGKALAPRAAHLLHRARHHHHDARHPCLPHRSCC